MGRGETHFLLPFSLLRLASILAFSSSTTVKFGNLGSIDSLLNPRVKIDVGEGIS